MFVFKEKRVTGFTALQGLSQKFLEGKIFKIFVWEKMRIGAWILRIFKTFKN